MEALCYTEGEIATMEAGCKEALLWKMLEEKWSVQVPALQTSQLQPPHTERVHHLLAQVQDQGLATVFPIFRQFHVILQDWITLVDGCPASLHVNHVF